MSAGGSREGAGRPSVGLGARERSVLFPADVWAIVEARAERDGVPASEALRRIVRESAVGRARPPRSRG